MEEQKWLAPYKINLKVFDIGENVSELAMKKIADSVKLLPKPIVIHTFRSDQPEARLFIKMYKD